MFLQVRHCIKGSASSALPHQLQNAPETATVYSASGSTGLCSPSCRPARTGLGLPLFFFRLLLLAFVAAAGGTIFDRSISFPAATQLLHLFSRRHIHCFLAKLNLGSSSPQAPQIFVVSSSSWPLLPLSSPRGGSVVAISKFASV